MARRDLSPLFNFQSMAFVGASDTSHFGLGAYRAMRDVGFAGAYYPINPKREAVHDTKAYPSVADIPGSVEGVVIAVAREHVIPAFRQAIAQGVKAAVVLSGNFGEGDETGKELQAQLAQLALDNDVILIGPNCMGAASVRNGRALYQGRGMGAAIKGGISVVSNSGGLMNEFLHYGNARALGFAHLVSSGNEADVSCSQLIDWYVDDPDTKVIVAILETVREPALFVEALDRAAVVGKPVLVLKLGTSVKGAASAITHTGAMAGDNAVWDALLDQKGAVRARDIDELVDLAAVFQNIGDILARRPLERAAVLEISGGSCELVCDVAEAAGVDLPEPSSATTDAIRPLMQDFLHVANPIDIGYLWTNPAMGAIYPPALDAFARQDDIDIIVSRYIVPPEEAMGALNDRLAELDAARKAHPDRLFVVASPTSNQYQPEWRTALAHYGLPFVPGFKRAFSALGKLADYSRRIRDYRASDAAPVAAMIPADAPITILNEVEAKDMLSEAGLPVVQTRLATSADEAAALGEAIGFPVAAKLLSPQMTHKSDAGGVRLNLRTAEELRAAYTDFAGIVAGVSGAVYDGMSVQAMAPPGGLELVLGAHRDPQFGPVILFGLGGIFVEVLKDTTLKVAPVSMRDATAMLDDIRAAEMLHGVRGRPGVDRGAVAQALVDLSTLMLARPEIESIDVNPAFAYLDGLNVADARIVMRLASDADVNQEEKNLERI
jgi:acyl-CoA synthetase (NDP forming)